MTNCPRHPCGRGRLGCSMDDCPSKPSNTDRDLTQLETTLVERALFASSVSTPAQDATKLAEAPNDAISAVMAEAYGMLGLELTLPQSRRLANAALRATSQTPDAVAELAYSDAGKIAACRCGEFPRLYGDGAKPDDGYRSLWCQTCMEHVTSMMPSEREVIDHWNDQREKEHATPPSASAGPQDASLREATAAQHFGLPKGQAAQFVRNGILETCQCRDCSKHESAVAVEALTYIKAVIENNAARCDDLLFDLDGETFDKNNGSVLGVIAVCQQMKASLVALATHVASAGPQAEAVPETGRVHHLKTWPEYFNEVLSGRKPFEWRVDDRDFKLGDTLVLQEYIPHPENPGREGKYTGREITKTVSYIFSPWATNKRTVVMGLAAHTQLQQATIKSPYDVPEVFRATNPCLAAQPHADDVEAARVRSSLLASEGLILTTDAPEQK